jgi:hypothetical protein
MDHPIGAIGTGDPDALLAQVGSHLANFRSDLLANQHHTLIIVEDHWFVGG